MANELPFPCCPKLSPACSPFQEMLGNVVLYGLFYYMFLLMDLALLNCTVRQMVMFSATWPPSVHQLAQEFMDPNPVKVVVGSEDLAANHDVMQIVEVIEDRSRDARLVALLEKYHKSQRNRVLVFVLYKKEASRVENMLQRRGWKVVSVHGDKAQHDRTKALSLFKDGTSPLMIATDVAARGLDIPDVEVVINYSFPLTTEDYVHRIGRTGRAGKKGVAHTFFMHENKGLAGELVNVLREAGQIVPDALMKFGTHVKKKESKLYGAHFKEITADAPKSMKIKFDNSDDED
ncbi:DEAD-box ATP-dependent RNA helicase 5-like [Macadamia integrifolia]|uniref:DEAD-box ATP-dependent RNA helicase 5-like n=1 Tax=Macadamia integrifolia TaxID=60698 RepID=UPI001C500B72|nr:DEAD-box ATP-dependent RNA helicase 5-like [Macadamia integrifolia]